MLTPDDAAAVLRRAAEIDTPALEQYDVLDEAVVRGAAREVGLSEAAVEQAVAEWRAGQLAPLPALADDRRAGLPGSVAVEAQVALPPGSAATEVEAWLRGQWFAPRGRRVQHGWVTQGDWSPRRGVLAAARRAADLDHRLRLSGVGRLRVCVAPAQSGSRVRVVADLRDLRTALLAGFVAAPAALTAGGLGVALLGGGQPDVLLALPAAAGMGGLGWLGARAGLARRHAAVADEIERALASLASARGRQPLAQRASEWALQRLPSGLR